MKRTYLKFIVLRYKDNTTVIEQQMQQMQGGTGGSGSGMNELYHQMMGSGVEQQEEQLINMIQSDPSMLNDPETKAIYDTYMAKTNQGSQQQQQQNTQQQQNNNQNQQVNNTQNQQVNNTQNNQQQTTQNQPQGNTTQISQEQFVQGGGGLFFSIAPKVDVSGVTPENLTTVLPQFGIDTTKPEWAKNLLLEFQSSKDKLTVAEEARKKLEQVDQNIQNLPTPLLHAMDASLKGKDWRKELSNFDIDYRLEFDKLSSEEQLKFTRRLLPELVIDDKDTTSPQYSVAINLGKNAFNQHKKSVEEEFERQRGIAELKNKTYLSSVGTSLAKLSENYEEFKEEPNVKEVKNILENKMFLRIFYDANGNLLEDAAERVALAIYGKNVVERAKNVSATQIANTKVASVISQQQTKGEGGNGVTNVTGNQQDALLSQMTDKAMKMYEQTY